MRCNEKPTQVNRNIHYIFFIFHIHHYYAIGSTAVKVRDYLVLEQPSVGKDCHLVGAGVVLGQQEKAAGSSVATCDSLA